MPNTSSATARKALESVIDPEIRRPITELEMVKEIIVDEAGIHATIALTVVGCPAANTIQGECEAALEAIAEGRSVTVELTVMTPEERTELTSRLRGTRPEGHPFTKNSLTRVIAVSSGKGGVGKSTVTANLAVDAARNGLRVGVIDADVFGFSIPGLLGLVGSSPTRIDQMIVPPVAHGVKVISIGMFVEPGTAVSWRGPMLHRTLNQFLGDVYFGDLDLLLIDLPPGTGDVAISLGQLLPQAEVIVVTTPQRAASDVAVRSGLVARQTGQTVIGVVETMSPAPGPDGTLNDLFGQGGGDAVAKALDVPLLGSIPLSAPLRRSGDDGVPVLIAQPGDVASEALSELGTAIRHSRQSRVGVALPVTLA